MPTENQDELITDAINDLTEKLSQVLLKEFMQLPEELQLNVILIKTTQLLLANILCHVVVNKEELEKIIEEQGLDIKEMTLNCAYSGFANKFNGDKH